MSHLAQPRFKDSLKKIRDEFEIKIRQPAIEDDPSLANLSLREFLDQAVTSDRAQDLEYATMVMQESLRFMPSFNTSFLYEAREDVKLGKYQFKKGD